MIVLFGFWQILIIFNNHWLFPILNTGIWPWDMMTNDFNVSNFNSDFDWDSCFHAIGQRFWIFISVNPEYITSSFETSPQTRFWCKFCTIVTSCCSGFAILVMIVFCLQKYWCFTIIMLTINHLWFDGSFQHHVV